MVGEIRDPEELQRAHDLLVQSVTVRELRRQIDPQALPGLISALDAICWTLRHDHNTSFATNLARLEERMRVLGFEMFRAEEMQYPNGKRPRIVCLCGSTRFWREFLRANRDETTAGRIVLSVGCFVGAPSFPVAMEPVTPEAKRKLDELHLRKIDLADEVLVLNVGGYIGESTRNEIKYAEAAGKEIRYLEPFGKESCMIVTLATWERIRDQFTEDEKATLRSATTGEVICPAGAVLDVAKLDAGLADKLTRALAPRDVYKQC